MNLAPRVVRQVERPDPAVVSQLARFGVATVYEAAGQCGLMLPYLRPIAQDQRACGIATTVLTHPGDNLMIHAAVEVARPGDVLVVGSTGAHMDGAVGELLTTQAAARGIVAMVLDTGVRDTAEIRRAGFPVWARVVSASATGKLKAGCVNTPIVCAGVPVAPGDVVVADDDGVVVVARQRAAQVLDACTVRSEREARAIERYRQGESSLDLNHLRERLAELGVVYVDREVAGSLPPEETP